MEDRQQLSRRRARGAVARLRALSRALALAGLAAPWLLAGADARAADAAPGAGASAEGAAPSAASAAPAAEPAPVAEAAAAPALDRHRVHREAVLAFSEADGNRDGALEKTEVTSAEAEGFDVLDVDHDGRLTLTEFVDARFAAAEAAAEDPSPAQ